MTNSKCHAHDMQLYIGHMHAHALMTHGIEGDRGSGVLGPIIAGRCAAAALRWESRLMVQLAEADNNKYEDSRMPGRERP
eukprot:scaffold9530_cov104-Isochrysis_galbana.AAC.1